MGLTQFIAAGTPRRSLLLHPENVAGDGGVGVSLDSVDTDGFFVLKRGEEAFGYRTAPAVALAANAGHDACAARVLPKAPLAYWLPRSEWNSTPAPTGQTDQA